MTDVIKSYELGEDAKRFMGTAIGKMFDKISQEDIEAAKHSMMSLDPFKFKTLADLQNKIATIQRQGEIATAVRGYIATAIENGRQAEHLLTEEEGD